MRANGVQAEEHEDERVRDAREQQALVAQGENDSRHDDERILQCPVGPIVRVDGQCDPYDGVKHAEDEKVAAMRDHSKVSPAVRLTRGASRDEWDGEGEVIVAYRSTMLQAA